jgi:hypothetical protein
MKPSSTRLMKPAATNPWLAWLACLAFVYPSLWIANSLVWSGVPLFRTAFMGDHLANLRLSAFAAMAQSVSSNGMGHGRFHSHLGSQLILLAIILAAALAANALARRAPLPAGLFIATLGVSAVSSPVFDLFFPRHPNYVLAVSRLLAFLALAAFGLTRLQAGWPAPTYGRGLLHLTAGVVLPVPALWLMLDGRFGPRTPVATLAYVLPGLLAALLAARRVSLAKGSGQPTAADSTASLGEPAAPQADADRAVGRQWAGIAAGVAATLLLGAGVRAGQAALQKAWRARTQAVLDSLPKVPASAPYPRLFFQKGVNFTAEQPATYDAQMSRQMLRNLPAYGINAIALMPYGWSDAKKPIVRFNPDYPSWENDAGIEELTAVAHAQGMKVMIKPAIWRAYDLNFPNPAERAQWFSQYQVFINHYARLAARQHIDLFCIGGEFVHLTPDAAAWRSLIAQVRQIYPGPLVYAANFGTEFESVSFWDALDYIGLQEYYPLPSDLSAEGVVARVEAVEKKYNKPVVFTEAGFPSLQAANRQPWDDGGPRPVDDRLQAECYEAIFNAFYKQPWFQGMYWWKVETNGSGGPLDGSHVPWNKPAMEVVKRWYRSGGRG